MIIFCRWGVSTRTGAANATFAITSGDSTGALENFGGHNAQNVFLRRFNALRKTRFLSIAPTSSGGSWRFLGIVARNAAPVFTMPGPGNASQQNPELWNKTKD